MFINLDTNDIYIPRGMNIQVRNRKGILITVPDRIFDKCHTEKFQEEFNILPVIDKGKKDDRYYTNKDFTLSTKKDHVVRQFSPVPRFSLEELRDQIVDREVIVLVNRAKQQETDNLKALLLGKPPVDILGELRQELEDYKEKIKDLTYDELVAYV